MTAYEILPGLPAYGPMAVPFGVGGWSGHSEGLVVRFDPGTPEAWVANFQPGCGGWEGILQHPNGNHLIVLSRGQGYVVDPPTRQLVLKLAASIQHVIELPELRAIVFCDGLGFEAIKSDGIWWRSPRISWDEVRNVKHEGTVLRGEAFSPIGDTWSSFTLDLLTGHCEDGVYQRDIRNASPVSACPADKS